VASVEEEEEEGECQPRARLVSRVYYLARREIEISGRGSQVGIYRRDRDRAATATR
jgi:hypothetical protein